MMNIQEAPLVGAGFKPARSDGAKKKQSGFETRPNKNLAPESLASKTIPIFRCSPSGFTLIETIVVLVMVGFLAVFMAQFIHVSYDEGAATVEYYQNEGNLQGMMEDVTARYRDMLTNGTLSLGALKSYAEAEFPGAVVTAETGYATFAPSGGNNYQASPVSQTPGANSVLLITLALGDQKVTSLFTE